jgi:hypothetical protein
VAGDPQPEHDAHLILALIRWATHYLRSQAEDADESTKAAIEEEAAALHSYITRDLDRYLQETETGEWTMLLPFEVQSMVTRILPSGQIDGPDPLTRGEQMLEAILGQRPDAGGDLYALNRALMRAKARREPIVRAIPADAAAGAADQQLEDLDGLSQRRVALLDVAGASLLKIEEFFANATFVPGLIQIEPIPSGGPHGIGIVVPEDDQVLGPVFALRRQANDALLDELWRASSGRWSFLAHPTVDVALLRYGLSAEVRPSSTAAPWVSIERAFLFDPQRLADMLRGFLEPGRMIWLVPESVAISAGARGTADPGNLYDDMLAHCLPVDVVPENARARSVEEALHWEEHWRRLGGLG